MLTFSAVGIQPDDQLATKRKKKQLGVMFTGYNLTGVTSDL